MFFRKLMMAGTVAMITGGTAAHAQPGVAFDPTIGAFRPMPTMAASAVTPQAAALRAGTYEVDVAIAVKFPYPTGTKPICTVTAGHTGAAGHVFQESATTESTGSKASWRCKVLLPYSWPRAETAAPVLVTISVIAGTDVAPRTRSHFRILPPMALPANHAVTKLSHSVTL